MKKKQDNKDSASTRNTTGSVEQAFARINLFCSSAELLSPSKFLAVQLHNCQQLGF